MLKRIISIAGSAVLGAVACTGAADPMSTPGIALIVVTPRDPLVSVGKSIQLSAKGYNFDDKAGFLWRTESPAVAHVTPSGMVTGVQRGEVTIVAKAVYDTTLVAVVRVVIE